MLKLLKVMKRKTYLEYMKEEAFLKSKVGTCEERLKKLEKENDFYKTENEKQLDDIQRLEKKVEELKSKKENELMAKRAKELEKKKRWLNAYPDEDFK